jgi:hypothetical protein
LNDSRQEAAVLGRLLAVISPANTPHGYNLTFAFPMLLFIVIAGALYLRFRSPHKVPGHAPIAVGAAAGPSVHAGHGATVTASPADHEADEAEDGAEGPITWSEQRAAGISADDAAADGADGQDRADGQDEADPASESAPDSTETSA